MLRTEGEQLVSQSIQLLKEMQAKQAMTNQSFNKHADHYQMSLDRLDKEIKMHQKHLEEVEETSQWNKHIAKTLEPAPDVGSDGFYRRVARSSRMSRANLCSGSSTTTTRMTAALSTRANSYAAPQPDLGVLDGLSPDDSAKPSTKRMRRLTTTVTGINCKEFSIFMNSFSHIKPKRRYPRVFRLLKAER